MVRSLFVLSLFALRRVPCWTATAFRLERGGFIEKCGRRSPLFSSSTMSAASAASSSENPNSTATSATTTTPNKKTQQKAMDFLKKIGRVGGDTDFRYAIGVDEGETGKSTGGKHRKVAAAFHTCTESGIIDDLSETFPQTSSGTGWSGFTYVQLVL
jgi:hypothetical protein